MPDMPKSLGRLKQEAKYLSKSQGIPRTEALEVIAQQYKFPNWKAVLKCEREYRSARIPTPAVSTNFTQDEDVELDETERKIVERQSDLAPDIKIQVANNKTYFASLGIEYSIFEPTVTGLKKSILDATRPVRTHFEAEDFHNFSLQGQGDEHKKVKQAIFVGSKENISSKVSLYRPKTKKGDPRMWFTGLGHFAQPEDQIAIAVLDDALYLFNFTQIDYKALSGNTNILGFTTSYIGGKYSVANELLNKLKKIAQSPIKSTIKGDTAVGMAIEHALGIPANSSKKPDYKGIELKGGRGKKNRSNLFAQVADWDISPLKSSAEILDKYGYAREGDFKLYCTLSTQKRNSQGLILKYEESTDQLIELDADNNVIAIWSGEILRSRLLEKHAETFWIQATSTFVDDIECFELTSVTHTKKPLVSQLIPLIQAGIVTMDHLIKRKAGFTGAAEKGPLFKINKRDLPFLFPEPQTHKLA